MVSTRGHPKGFPEPDMTPTRSTPSRVSKGKWAHIPSNLAIIEGFTANRPKMPKIQNSAIKKTTK
jgi:hypothetical protein